MPDQANQQSNPFSTGGGGSSFENRVQAAFAVLMLTGRVAPCLPPWPVVKIKLQGKYAGFDTDDFIVFVQEALTRRECKLLAQIKHSVSITEGDQVLSDVILSAWRDFNDSTVFSEGSDTIALITGPLSSTDTNNVRPLLDWARHCSDADEFIGKVNTTNFSSDAKRKKLNIFRAHLKSANGGENVTDDLLWRFLKSFNLIGYDLDSTSSSTLALLYALISQNSLEQAPEAVWSQIVTFIQSANQNAGTITHGTIPESILSCFNISVNRVLSADLRKLHDHSDYILRGIRTDVAGIHINRRDIFGQLLDLSERSSFVFLSGGRGCGKSSLVREFAQFVENCHPVFCLRTEDLNESHLDRAFATMGMQSSLSDLAAGFAMIPRKFLLIESLEKLLELRNTGAFIDLIHFLQTYPGWTVIASGRDYAYQQITFHYLQPHGINWSSLTVPEFSDDDIDILCSQNDTLKPLAENDAIKQLLKVPFLADLASRVTATGTRFSRRDNETVFRSAVWRDVIFKEQERANGMPLRRKQTFTEIAVKRAKLMVYGVSDSDFDSEVLLKLEEDNLIRRDPSKGLVSPGHDVLEDWALEAHIERAFQRSEGNIVDFLDAAGQEPAMNRAFRLWLHQRLRDKHTKSGTLDLVRGVLTSNTLQSHWQDEAISAVLMGENPLEFLHSLSDLLFEKQGELLKRFCFILRISCKAPDSDLIRQITQGDDNLKRATEPLFLRPYGNGWQAIIQFLHENMSRISTEFLPHIGAVLEEWALPIQIGKDLPPEAREAGLLSINFLEGVKDTYRDDGNGKKLLGVIIRTLPAIKSEFLELIEKDVLTSSTNRRPGYVRELLVMVLTRFETIYLCKYIPDVIIKLAWQEWFIEEVDEDHPRRYRSGVPEYFGLHEHKEGTSFFPASGAKGPFPHLLRYHPRKGMDFIIALCNRAAEKYAHSTLDSKEKESVLPSYRAKPPFTVEIPLSDGTVVKQYCSHRLWSGYRGTAVLPYLLQSALMALENWLIAMVEHSDKTEKVERVIDYIMRNSNSVMTTAVIASVATGFPEKLGRAALPLLRTPDLYHWDMIRSIQERTERELNWFGPSQRDPMWEIYAAERHTAALRPWRREHLESLATRLEFTELRDEIFNILDGFRANIPKSDTKNDEGWRFRLHRIDIRGWDPQVDKEKKRILFTPKELEPDLLESQKKTQKDQDLINRVMALFLWSEHTIKGEPLEREYYSGWRVALQEAKALLETLKNEKVNEFARMQFGGIVKTASLCLRDHSKELSEADLEWSASLVLEAVYANADTQDMVAIADATDHDGASAAAEVLPIILDFAENIDDEKIVKLMISTALTHANDAVRKGGAQGIQRHLWQRDPDFAKTCIDGGLEYARLSLEEIRNRHNLERLPFAETSQEVNKSTQKDWKADFRERMVAGEVTADPNQVSFDSHSSWHLLTPCLMIPDGSTKTEHLALMSKMLSLLLDAEESKTHREYEQVQIADDLTTEFAKRFADYFLSIPGNDRRRFLSLLIQRSDSAPDFLHWLLVCLLCSAEKRGNINLYWEIWKAFAEKAATIAVKLSKTSGRDLHYDHRREFILGMLFADISWQRVKPEQEILIPGLELLFGFVEKAGVNPLVFEAMCRFLFYFPQLFMPRGIIILAKHQKSIGGTHLLSGVNTVFYLERVLQNLLILAPEESNNPKEIREISLVLLNAMIEAGSSCAYFLRDHLIHSGSNLW